MSNDVNKLKQRLEIRKYLVFAGMFLLFLGAMWLIFAPSEEEKKKEEKNAGFNTELPDPREAGIEGDKIAAYEQADMKRKQTEKLRTLEDFSGMADGNSGTVVELSPDADAKDGSSREGDRRNEACSSSVSAYNDINRTLGNFYESPQEDPEKEALKAEVEHAGILFFANRNTANQLAFQTIHVPSGQRVDIVLPDSTHVWLNANTTMTYPLAFMEDRREVIIDGEAYFEVKHNAKCPFTVHTAQMDVTDLGTKFNVEAYSDKGYTETSLMEGKVEIGVGGKQTYVLEPGQKLWVMGGQIKRSTIDDPDTYRWREGLNCFNNKPVSSIMKDFEKYYGIRIQIRKKSIRNVVLSGKFRIAEGLDYALSVMQAEVPFQYHRNEEDSTLYIE